MPKVPARFPIAENAGQVRDILADNPRVIDDFHRLLYASGNWKATRWMGVPVLKLPADLWLYQEILFAVKPDLIIETGTALGGSALYFASLLDLFGLAGRVVTIDITVPPERPRHDRITYVTGSSTDPAIAAEAARLAHAAGRVMVVLDSSHLTSHVARELELYAGLVTPGSYLVVEDGNVDGNPVWPDYREDHSAETGGPQEAIQHFLQAGAPFEIDTTMHRYAVSHNPNGYLRRRA